MSRHCRIWAMAIVAACLPTSVRAQDPATLAADAKRVLEATCFRCHGKDGSQEGGFGYVLDVKQLKERKRVVPGSPEKSRLFLRMVSMDENSVMPPADESPRPTKADIDAVGKWIAAGAPDFPEKAAPVVVARKPLSLNDTYQAMYKHLMKWERYGGARYQRFFTITHLHNDPAVTEENLRLYRAALAKMLNSLSWRNHIVLPRPVDDAGTVLAIDLRDLDWDLNGNWAKIVGFSAYKGGHKGYPYALTHERCPDHEELNVAAAQVYRLTGTEIPAVRADWFIATASVPPLYHELLNLPKKGDDLDKQLKVNVAHNFQRDVLVRAGFVLSGVSGQNRLVERHPGLFGAYWKSYDFKLNEGRGNLLQFPLGPLNLFPKDYHPYPHQAFEHDGGELIWALPNGLHAYLLIDGKGDRIDEGPVDVVRDKNGFAGKGPLIVNGLSCMGCHRHGMVPLPPDEIRASAGVQGKILDKVKRLFPKKDVMDRWVDQDEAEYLVALEKIVGPYLRVGADKDKDLKLFPEPVTSLASPFLRGNVKVDEAARELYLDSGKELQAIVKGNGRLRDELGLKVWANDGTLKRSAWHSVINIYSPYQEAAAELQRGTPVRIRRAQEDLP